jgi:hypothetical protein
MTFKIDAIITCSNTNGNVHHLRPILEAVAKQKLIRAILVIDESVGKDDFVEIVSLISPNQKNFKVVKGNYHSPGVARNAGLEHAKSEFLTFWDFDDSPSIDSFSICLNLVTDSHDVLVMDYLERDENSYDFISRNASSISPYKLAKSVGLWRMMFRQEIIKGHEFLDSSMGEDQAFLHSIKIMDLEVLRVNLVGYVYSKNFPNSLTSSRRRISDLIFTSRFIESTSHKLSRESSLLASNMIVRQRVSLIKYGNPGRKILEIISLVCRPRHLIAIAASYIEDLQARE